MLAGDGGGGDVEAGEGGGMQGKIARPAFMPPKSCITFSFLFCKLINRCIVHNNFRMCIDFFESNFNSKSYSLPIIKVYIDLYYYLDLYLSI